MLPIMIYAYKCGTKWGLGAGLTFSVLQLLFGLLFRLDRSEVIRRGVDDLLEQL